MKNVFLIGFSFLSATTAFADLNLSETSEGNSLYPVVIAIVMIVGAIAARVIAKRKSAKTN